MTFQIRPATHDDLPAVSALLAETWHATYDGIYGAERVAGITRRWHAVEALARGVGKPDQAFLVATQDEHIVGTLSIGKACGGLKLDRLYIHPSAQGRGLGRGLLDVGLGTFPSESKVTLEVEPANEQAIHFYERNGFVVTGRTGDCGCAGDGIAALIMTRDRGASAKPVAPLAKSAVSSDGMTAKR